MTALPAPFNKNEFFATQVANSLKSVGNGISNVGSACKTVGSGISNALLVGVMHGNSRQSAEVARAAENALPPHERPAAGLPSGAAQKPSSSSVALPPYRRL